VTLHVLCTLFADGHVPTGAKRPRSAGTKHPCVEDGATVTVGPRKGAANPKGDVKADEDAPMTSERIPIVSRVETGRHTCHEGPGHGHATDPSKARVDDLRAIDDDTRSDRTEESL